MDTEQLLARLAKALDLPAGEVLTADASQGTIEQWDSLGHLAILATLDETFDDISERAEDLIEVESVEEILQILRRCGLLS